MIFLLKCKSYMSTTKPTDFIYLKTFECILSSLSPDIYTFEYKSIYTKTYTSFYILLLTVLLSVIHENYYFNSVSFSFMSPLRFCKCQLLIGIISSKKFCKYWWMVLLGLLTFHQKTLLLPSFLRTGSHLVTFSSLFCRA